MIYLNHPAMRIGNVCPICHGGGLIPEKKCSSAIYLKIKKSDLDIGPGRKEKLDTAILPNPALAFLLYGSDVFIFYPKDTIYIVTVIQYLGLGLRLKFRLLHEDVADIKLFDILPDSTVPFAIKTRRFFGSPHKISHIILPLKKFEQHYSILAKKLLDKK